jgi:hypothetical protein
MASKQAKIRIQSGHCPECGSGRHAEVVAAFATSWNDDENAMWGGKEWLILRCRGCDTVYVQTIETFSEDTDHWCDESGEWHEELNEKIAHWPAPVRRAEPDWSAQISRVDRSLGALVQDVYGALNADLAVPAAIAMRTAFDRASEILGIDSALSFGAKLDALETGRRISGDEKDTLAVLIDAGSAAVHRGWRPRSNELDTMIQMIEAFLHRTFVLGDAAKELRKQIPPKPTRKSKPQKKAGDRPKSGRDKKGDRD